MKFNLAVLPRPLIVAPMAGGPSSVDLVVAGGEAGALGSIGAAYLKPHSIYEITKQVRERTSRPFAINLFVPGQTGEVRENWVRVAIRRTQKFRDEFGLPEPRLVAPYAEDFGRQFGAVLALKPAVLSFIFGLLTPDQVRAAHDAGIFLIGTATTIAEANALERSGVDAVVLQGVEAGGHRGIFDPAAADPNVATFDLVTAARDLRIPVIAAGGIMNRDDVRRMLDAGAAAVQMGTAFLAVEEAGTAPPYRAKLLEGPQRTTRLTRAFSGRPARGVVNRFVNEIDEGTILPFPAQNQLTRELRSACAAAGSSDYLSLWCGAGEGALWTGSARELIANLFGPLPERK